MGLTQQQRRLQRLDPDKFPAAQLFILGKSDLDIFADASKSI